ncbi:MAG TPA: DUF2961 domain-containing protein [Phycisphaerae bacterium]|nr:DUF2961 domain-containing protein [Phycisphaerae bacterium]
MHHKRTGTIGKTGAMLGVLMVAFPSAASEIPTTAGDAYRMPSGHIETRWYTRENPKGEKGKGGTEKFGRKGAPCAGIGKGQSLTLLDVQGSGTVRRIWATLWDRSPEALRGLKIEAYWDGAATPAVQGPFGDFFCHSLGHMATFENDCFASPEGRSFNCFVAMPFKKSAKIVLINESPKDNGIYYDIAVTHGDQHGDDMLYFHSFWRRENMTKLRQDMTILPKVEGRGRFLGCNLGVRLHPAMTGFWWGEGEVKVYIDGDKEYPTLCGTGTEDYIGTGYGQGYFTHRYQGNQFIGKLFSAFGFYRFHLPDPLFFHKDIRVTIQVMGGPSYEQMIEALGKDPSLKFMKAGDGTQFYTREELEKEPKRAEVMERIDDHCAQSYWYMDKPENGLGPIAPAAERMKDLPEKP